MLCMDAETETFLDVERLVHDITHSFLRHHGISRYDYEEWHAEACLAFAFAYRDYDRNRSRFSTCLWKYIWYALREKVKQDAPHWNLPSLPENADIEFMKCPIDYWSEPIDTSRLSSDACGVIRIVLGSFGQIDTQEAKPGEIRLLIYDFLSGMGWSFQRVVESFSEIRTALFE